MVIEARRLAALTASRVCHDMAEPLNAIIQGLEFLKDSDAAVKNADAISLMDSGVQKAWAKLDFMRFAFGGSGATDGETQLDEARAVIERLYGVLKPSLDWQVKAVMLPRPGLKVFANMMLIAADCLPRGGVVTVKASAGADGPEIRAIAAGPRAMLKPPTAMALRGEAPEEGFTVHTVQPALTGLLAAAADIQLLAREAPERIELILRSKAFKLSA
jgi:histidine phosphotransferase ChpT